MVQPHKFNVFSGVQSNRLMIFFDFLGTVYNDTLYFLGYSNKTVINLAMILRDI